MFEYKKLNIDNNKINPRKLFLEGKITYEEFILLYMKKNKLV